MLTAKQRRGYRLREVADSYGMSIDAWKRLAKSGAIKTFLVGNCRIVPLSELERIEQNGLPLPSGRQRKGAR